MLVVVLLLAPLFSEVEVVVDLVTGGGGELLAVKTTRVAKIE